jgi:CRISPR system Cascade subunit CasE
MNEGVVAFASVLRLTRRDTRILGIKDAYSLHKVVYGLFDDIRDDHEKQGSHPSGILFVDKGGVSTHTGTVRQVLLLSTRAPHQTPQFGLVETRPIHEDFLAYDHYAFTVTINPGKRDRESGKVQPVKGREAVAAWFADRSQNSWGFAVDVETLLVENVFVQTFEKEEHSVTHGGAVLKGSLTVTDPIRFKKSFIQGIGRGRAFGFGLLQIVPLTA